MNERLPAVRNLPEPVQQAIKKSELYPRPKQSFANCQRLVLFADLPQAEYYEGLARCGAEVFPHAWIELDGEYVDITLCDTTPVHGWHVSREEIRAMLARCGQLGPVRNRELEAAHAAFVRTNGGHP